MKVLELFGEPFAFGGQEAYIINVLQHIDMTDLQIDFLTPYSVDNENYKKIIEEKGGKITAFNLPFNPGGLRFSIKKPLNRFLKENHYDVVHIHSGSISVLALCSAIAKKHHVKKIIVHSHSAGEKKTLKNTVTRLAAMPILAHCPTDYCACSVLAGEWKYSRRIVNKKLRILNNGVDLNKFAYNAAKGKEIRQKWGISDESFVVGNVGRFCYEKNQSFLVNVFAEVKKIKPDSKLMLIGIGDTQDSIREQVNTLGLQNDVIFVGAVNNVYEHLWAMDVFALPSWFEGMPIVLIEAQAAGLPAVVSQNVTSDAKLIDEVTFLSLEETPAVWAEAICKMPRPDPASSETIAKKGYDIVGTSAAVRQLYLE